MESIYLPGLGEGVPIRSARAAIIVAIKALGLTPGSRIGVPLYCCPVVFKAIKAADCIPCFVDIEPETYCLSLEDLKKKCTVLDSLIAVHMFGNTCDMPGISEIMANKPVIEDCAQSLGSMIAGRPSGSFGDVSFFSFRSGKYLSAGEGGALHARAPEILDRINEMVTNLVAPTRFNEIKHVAEVYIRSKVRSRPLWGLVGSRIWAIYNMRTEFSDKSPIALGRIYLSDLATIRGRMPHLNSMISQQREHAEHYARALHLESAAICRERPGHFYNRFMFPIIFSTPDQRNDMASYLMSRGIGTSRPYEDVAKGAASHYGYKSDCKAAEHALRTTLVIPSYYSIGTRMRNRIIRAFNQGVAEIKNGGQ